MKDLLNLYWTFVKIGCVTFGGGYAMLPILERELVDKRHWTTMDDLRDYFSIGQCTPGIIAMNAAATQVLDHDDPLMVPFVKDLAALSVPYRFWRYYDGMLYIIGLLATAGKIEF